jgi:CRP-like cAMP-binding protein
LPAEVWEALVARGERRVYREGSALFLEGDPPGPVIAVIDGELRAEAARGRVLVDLGVFGAGTVVGEVAALDGLPRSASVIATRRTEVAAIGGVDFNELLVRYPVLALWVLRLFAERLRATTAARTDTAANGVEARVAAVLVDLARARGIPIGTLVMVDVLHEELADLVRADPEDTSRALAKLHALGWVLPGREGLHVVNLDALVRASGVHDPAGRLQDAETGDPGPVPPLH